VPHEKWGETPKAVVVLRDGSAANADELIAWTRDKLGAVKRVTSVEFVDDLPTSALGKVLRREVKARFWMTRRAASRAHDRTDPAHRVRRSRQRPGAGPRHGLGGNLQSWIANIPTLSARHRVIALDLPGFGRSAPLTEDVTMAGYADATIGLLDRLGVASATFVGNSMGGLLTIEAAARHPDRVDAAVLACSGGIPADDVAAPNGDPPGRPSAQSRASPPARPP